MDKTYIKPELYYKWMSEVEKFYKNEAKAKLVESQAKVLQLQSLNAKLSESLFQYEVKRSKELEEKSKAEYESFIEKLKSEVGVDLKGKAINPDTFEIVTL